ncbi:MAG: apolipoprotein N-acyltransferase [Gammaproteobacteria bacterium]|nr:apolipoprotein N-acyltransferase [Gammaproteobacteria bacterium]
MPGPPLPAERRIDRLLAFIAGASLVLTFAPFEMPWLAPLPLALLLWLLRDAAPAAALRYGFLFGLGFFGCGTYWLYVSLNVLGGLLPPFAVLLMLCLIAATATFVAAAAWLTVRVTPRGSVWLRGLIVFPAAWVLTEWGRGWMVTGFPWQSLGYGQVETPFGTLAAITGVYGVTWAVVLMAGALYVAVMRGWATRMLLAASVIVMLAGLQSSYDKQWTVDAGKPLRIGLVQGAIPQELKWNPAQLQPTLDLYRRLSLELPDRDLIVWPEAAVPALPFEVPDFLEEMHEVMVERDTQLFTGILTFQPENGTFLNTLWAIGAEQGQYHKRHLVMFGEYFPLPNFVKRWLRIMNLPSESIAPGADDQPLLTARGVPVAATICYELAFGAEQLGFLPEAQLLINVSNDAWFGDTIAPHQHLQIGQMRARESGRWLLRATNTGITAVVDPAGQVTERIAQFEPGVIIADVIPRSGATPYVRAGNYPVIALALWCILAALLWNARRATR